MRIDVAAVSQSWENKRILEEISERGMECAFIDPRNVSYELGKEVKLFYKDSEYTLPDVLLVRGGFTSVVKDDGRRFLNILETLGVKVVDAPVHVSRDYDKVFTLAMLSRAKVPHPKSYFIRCKSLLKAIDLEKPVVKPILGSKGRDVSREEDFKSTLRPKSLIQEFIEAGGSDIRVFVIGGKVVASGMRKAKEGEWRSNVALGGGIEAFRPTKEVESLAVKAAKVMGIEIAGVDIVLSEGKPYVIEVNRAPQFQGLVAATGIDIPKLIVDYLEKVA